MRTRRRLMDTLSAELSGALAVETTRKLTRFYRSAGSSGYHRATDLVAQTLSSYGIEHTRQTYPFDGKTTFLGSTMPLAWEPFGAELTMIHPSTEHLVSFDEAPSCLVWWSKPTPDAGAEYEVIDAGTGERQADFEGKDVRGKAVFARGTRDTDSWESWMRVANLARENGAAGIITDYLLRQAPPHRTRESLPEAVQLLRFPPEFTSLWGLAINYLASQKLAAALAQGPVKVFAAIQCRTFVGEGVNLTASIRGSELPHESVYFCAHLTAATKPAANCAQGVALATEVARTFQTLIEQGKLPRPRRSLKFLFLAEGNGSSYFFDRHPEAAKRILLAFNYCSVGHAQDKVDSALMFYRVPDSAPSFVNDFCSTLLAETPKETNWVGNTDRRIPLLNFVEVPFIARSDNGIWNQRKVPTPMIMSSPDRYFHTQFLTADKSDPRVFRRAGIATAAAAYEIADAGEQRAAEILLQIKSRGAYRISQVAAALVRQLIDASSVDGGTDTRGAILDRALREVRYLLARDGAAAETVMQLVRNDSRQVQQQVGAGTEAVKRQLERVADDEIAAIQAAVTAAERQGKSDA